MTSIEPGNVLQVTPVEIQAAKLRLAADRRRGVVSDPRIVRIANATPAGSARRSR